METKASPQSPEKIKETISKNKKIIRKFIKDTNEAKKQDKYKAMSSGKSVVDTDKPKAKPKKKKRVSKAKPAKPLVGLRPNNLEEPAE